MNREVAHVLEQTMTVRNLIEALQGYDQDARVLLTCDYGDYHHTEQALPITEVEEFDTSSLAESGYSQSHVSFTGDDDGSREERESPRTDKDEDDDNEEIVLLRH